MRRWYEPRKDRPDLERSAIRKRGFVGYMDMLWREFFELLKLNLLFVLSCVPIITIPAALTAMHRITSVMVRDENHFLWPDYWKAFRRDFWKSLGGGAAIADCVRFGTIAALMSVRSVVWIRFRLIAPTSARFQHGIGRILSGKHRVAHSIVSSHRTCQQTADQEHQFPIIQPLFSSLSFLSSPVASSTGVSFSDAGIVLIGRIPPLPIRTPLTRSLLPTSNADI